MNLETLEQLRRGHGRRSGRAARPGPRRQARSREDPRLVVSSPRSSPSRPTASPKPRAARDRRCGRFGRADPASLGRSPPAGRRQQRPDQSVGWAAMLSRLRNMFRVPDLRNKILFTLAMVGVYRLGAHLPVPYVDFCGDQEAPGQGEQQRRRRVPRPLLGRRDHQRRDLLPRDHAVHHGVDHHAAARGRDPQARAVAAGGPGRAEEDHPVDALPHGRAGARAVDRLRVRAAPGSGRAARLRCPPAAGHRLHPGLQLLACGPDRARLDRGYRDRDVDR